MNLDLEILILFAASSKNRSQLPKLTLTRKFLVTKIDDPPKLGPERISDANGDTVSVALT
jgi:hypothetical protein